LIAHWGATPCIKKVHCPVAGRVKVYVCCAQVADSSPACPARAVATQISLVESRCADVANLRPSDTRARQHRRFFDLSWWGGLALAQMLGLFLPRCRRSQMEHHAPIIKSDYFAAIVNITAAIGLLAIIAMLLFVMPW
jgi:hypothetical protein